MRPLCEIDESTLIIMNEYLEKVVKNCDKCKNCSFHHKIENRTVCFFAYYCISDNFQNYKPN